MPEYEEREAMARAHCNPREWRGLSWQERARAIASYRIAQYVALHSSDAQAEEVQRKQRSRGDW